MRYVPGIADNPTDYWEGALAKDIEADIKENDGIVTAEDLRDYEPLWKACNYSFIIRVSLLVQYIQSTSTIFSIHCTRTNRSRV